MTGELQRLGSTPSDQVGDFYEKVLALNSEEERLALLKRGQTWVARKVAEMLPRIKDDHLHARLKHMLVIHEENIADMA